MPRKMSFEQAKSRFPYRFTMEHIPHWARSKAENGKFYAPQYRTDREWYDNTEFFGEGEMAICSKHCYSTNESWPMGQWLNQPFQKEITNA